MYTGGDLFESYGKVEKWVIRIDSTISKSKHLFLNSVSLSFLLLVTLAGSLHAAACNQKLIFLPFSVYSTQEQPVLKKVFLYKKIYVWSFKSFDMHIFYNVVNILSDIIKFLPLKAAYCIVFKICDVIFTTSL